MDWQLLYKASQLLFVVALAAVGWRRREVRVLLWYFLFLLANDEVRHGLAVLRADVPGPFVGWHRVGLHFDQLLYLAINGVYLPVVGYYFRDRRVWIWAAVGLVPCWLAMVIAYPDVDAGRAYAVARLIVLVAEWFIVLRGAHRLLVRPGVPHLCIMLFLGADSVVAFHGFVDLAWSSLSRVVAAWDAVRATYLLVHVIGTAALLASLRERDRAAMERGR